MHTVFDGCLQVNYFAQVPDRVGKFEAFLLMKKYVGFFINENEQAEIQMEKSKELKPLLSLKSFEKDEWFGFRRCFKTLLISNFF